MTVEELRWLIEDVIDQKLEEYFGDPDEGLEVQDWLVERLKQQMGRVEQGERGRSMSEVLSEFEQKEAEKVE